MISEGRRSALWAVVVDGTDTWHCAGIYELEDARIAHGVEVWTREGVERPAGLGR